jgi:mono/diheme cytochrome c family protein
VNQLNLDNLKPNPEVMKKTVKYVGYLLLFLAVAIGVLLTYVKAALPDVGEAENLKIEYTPERVARGKYLATSVTVCIDCHSKRDWTQFSGPLVAGTLGQGGERFDQRVGLPGVFIAKNITPHGISRYTDGELFRVITTGVSKEGKAMFPLMPYPYYGRMDPEDIYSIIAYVRSLDPIKNEVEQSQPDFPMNFIINTIPKPANHQKRPDKSDQIAYGAYMINATACAECHTQVNKGQIIPELVFGGGREFPFADGSIVRSANITPDDETGIGKWTEELFIQKFKVYADSAYVSEKIKRGEFNSWMPWTMYAKMERDDLAAIFHYLKSVKPVSNKVTKFTARSN